MADITHISDLEAGISRAVEEYVKERVAQVVESAKTELDRQIPEIAAAVAVKVASAIDPLSDSAIIQIRLNRQVLGKR